MIEGFSEGNILELHLLLVSANILEFRHTYALIWIKFSFRNSFNGKCSLSQSELLLGNGYFIFWGPQIFNFMSGTSAQCKDYIFILFFTYSNSISPYTHKNI